MADLLSSVLTEQPVQRKPAPRTASPKTLQQTLKRPRIATGARRPAETIVNVAAIDKGWFFEDLKTHFAKLPKPGVHIVTSERPLRHADAWIMIRTHEAASAPDLGRTVVQIHDMFEHDL